MNNEEMEFLLFDRIEKIKSINAEYDLENNAHISFSGGKDSTILHYLFDIALPNNKIPRIFINTNIEYKAIVDFVKELQKTDDRIIIVNANVNIKQMLEKYGYPFKSKEHSLKVGEYQRGSRAKHVIDYKTMQGKSKFSCPKKLLYQYEPSFKIKLSDKCCYKLKKEPIASYEKEIQRFIAITGMRKSEGGERANLSNCIITRNDKVVKFHPLLVVNEQFEDWFIKKYNIKLCKLYYPPYNFKRTGCAGCPYSLWLNQDLETMRLYLPNEYKKCWLIWRPIYEEYKRIGYRGFSKYEQIRLF
jgi:3'-phosphoadenosine 5'-phosphosulfate sulfotransferase (PAPS reductase)/FAD synthetase